MLLFRRFVRARLQYPDMARAVTETGQTTISRRFDCSIHRTTFTQLRESHDKIARVDHIHLQIRARYGYPTDASLIPPISQ